MSGPDPNCNTCRLHYVTYEADRPHGCRAYGFKSRLLPAMEVLRSSGQPCMAFEPRLSNPPNTGRVRPWPAKKRP